MSNHCNERPKVWGFFRLPVVRALRLKRDSWFLVKHPRQTGNEYASSAPPSLFDLYGENKTHVAWNQLAATIYRWIYLWCNKDTMSTNSSKGEYHKYIYLSCNTDTMSTSSSKGEYPRSRKSLDYLQGIYIRYIHIYMVSYARSIRLDIFRSYAAEKRLQRFGEQVVVGTNDHYFGFKDHLFGGLSLTHGRCKAVRCFRRYNGVLD